MDFERPKYRPNIRKEETREELLSQAKQARHAREQDRSFLKSAVAIQKIYRGHAARLQVQQQVITEWLKLYGPRAADVKDVPTAAEISGEILPPLLHLVLPVTTSTSNAGAERAHRLPSLLRHKDSCSLLLGCFGLSLRSCAAVKQAVGTFETPAARNLWVRQMQRLTWLGAELCGSGRICRAEGEGGRLGILESVAARLLYLLTHWSVTNPDTTLLQRSFRADCSRDSRLVAALHRMLGRATSEQRGEKASAWIQNDQAHQAAIVNVLKAALSPLEDAKGDITDYELQTTRQLLASPHLLARLSEGAVQTLRHQQTYSRLALAVRALAGEGNLQMSPSLWVWMLVNFGGLSAGTPQSKNLKDGRVTRFYQGMELLSQPGQVACFLETGTAILKRASKASPAADPDMAGALAALTLFSDGTFVNAILTALGRPPRGDDGIPAFTAFYGRLMCVLAGSGGAQASPELPLCNALAFGGRDLLPRMWRWLAQNVGLPLEAPMEATRGWDIQALRHGAAGFVIQHAATLTLFCRIYAHQLLVVDDEDFHVLQQTFTLAQQRAIATALNTLVFRCHSPSTPSTAADARVATSSKESQPLKEAACTLLRALYQRDVRRPFCPPALWLAPYEASTTQQDFSAHGVVTALLSATDSPSPTRQVGRSAVHAALLLEAPHCIPFDRRVEIFRCLVAGERDRWSAPSKALEITVRREALLEDGFAALRHSGPAIKGRLKVKFVRHGSMEPGQDAGGLVKEFLEEVVKAGFNAEYGLMTATSEGLAYPQPASNSLAQGHQLLEFLGLMLGKALYEGILLDWPLAPFFVTKLQGRRPVFDELSALDADLHRNLLAVKRYEGDAEDLGLTFAVEDETFGRRVSYPLVPGGAEVAVTSHNRLQYVLMAADWHLNGRLGGSSAAFARGINQVIPATWLRLFNPREVNQLLAGGEGGGMEVDDLQAHTEYSGGYTHSSPTVKLFWQVVRGLTNQERQAMLRFVTSCSRAPLGGFAHLRPAFQIQKVACHSSPLASLVGRDVERLPSAATCFNLLKLPNYKRSATLRRCLVYAITSNSGFELS